MNIFVFNIEIGKQSFLDLFTIQILTVLDIFSFCLDVLIKIFFILDIFSCIFKKLSILFAESIFKIWFDIISY